MIRMVPQLVAFAILATTTSAFAQSGGPPAGDYRGPGDSVPMSRFDLNESAQRDIRQRMGPEQRRLELVQTTLLNRFAALGFAELIDIDKAGVNYLARVRTVNGETVNVTIDPMSGEIIGMQPVAVIVAAEPQPGTTARTPQSGSSGSQSSGGGEYAPMGTCQPAGWASLSDRIDQLPQNKQLTANRLMRQIWENYSDGDSIACREKLEDLSDIVGAPKPQSASGTRTQQSGSSGSGSSSGIGTSSGEYASMGSCQPAGWASLSDRIDQLPQNKQLTANRLMRQIWENYSDGDSIACREKLEDLSDMVRSASAR